MRIEQLPFEGRGRYARQLVDLRAAYITAYPFLIDPNHEMLLRAARRHCNDPNVVIVAAFDGDRLVACNVSEPLTSAGNEYDVWAEQAGEDKEDWMHSIYVASYPEYQAKGVSSAMGAVLNDIAKGKGYKGRIIKMINRPEGDPKAPEGYRSAVGYFLKQGYELLDMPETKHEWIDIGDTEYSEKTYSYLLKRFT